MSVNYGPAVIELIHIGSLRLLWLRTYKPDAGEPRLHLDRGVGLIRMVLPAGKALCFWWKPRREILEAVGDRA